MNGTPRRVSILGSTGSIGDSTLDVVSRHPDRFRVHALSGRRRIDKLYAQCLLYRPEFAVVGDHETAVRLRKRLAADDVETSILHGRDGLDFVAGNEASDIVVTGIVGAAGLESTLAAVGGRRRVLIANKEPLVMMGRTILGTAQNRGATVIPLDSEHNAIFQCLAANPASACGRPAGVRRLLLTASGGPFRTLPTSQLANVTPTQAIAHPNWSMGPKISVDSATLMNKGLELIEACALFNMSPDDVRVVIHPQSTVHSMVEYLDGSVIAQMGAPDMRIPIAHGLGWPDRIDSGAASLDFYSMNQLDFEAPDEIRFPCLRLARQAAEAAGAVPVVLNAANEVAVAAFLESRLSFANIPAVISSTLDSVSMSVGDDLESVLEVDAEARRVAHARVQSDARSVPAGRL